MCYEGATGKEFDEIVVVAKRLYIVSIPENWRLAVAFTQTPSHSPLSGTFHVQILMSG